MSEFQYGLAALRRFREQRVQVESLAEPVQADDDDDFDDLFDAWIDFNMEVPG